MFMISPRPSHLFTSDFCEVLELVFSPLIVKGFVSVSFQGDVAKGLYDSAFCGNKA
jgi:hypothetical protein